MNKIGKFVVNDSGSVEFRNVLDSIDIGGKVGEEYYDAKLIFLAQYFYLNDSEALVSILLFGRILTVGVQKALHETEAITWGQALRDLGILDRDDYRDYFRNEVKRNRTKIESLRPIIKVLGSARSVTELPFV